MSQSSVGSGCCRATTTSTSVAAVTECGDCATARPREPAGPTRTVTANAVRVTRRLRSCDAATVGGAAAQWYLHGLNGIQQRDDSGRAASVT